MSPTWCFSTALHHSGAIFGTTLVPLWYHFYMAMNLRLTPEQTAGLRAAAEQDGVSMQEAALAAVDAYISRRPQRLADAISRVAKENAELLLRLSK